MKFLIKSTFYSAILFALLISGLNSCKDTTRTKKVDKKTSEQTANTLKNKKIPAIKEAFHTDRDEGDNVDSPAVWHGDDGEHWLLATAKEGNAIIVYSAEDGSFIKKFGESGEKEGAFSRPNGITVFENLLLIVERDNHRIQVFNLPTFEPLGFFGQKSLKKPYGISVMKKSENNFIAYITDNYETKDEQIPPIEKLNKRVHMFSFEVKDNQLTSMHKKAFGDIKGDGILYKVESILIDKELERLLIADEYSEQRNIKIYSLEGEFTGEIISSDYFDSEPEGIALFECKKDTTGYYITTDQDYKNNKFEVFDRKTFKHLGSFSGALTRNTDGVALTQKNYGNFDNGAFFPVHDDGSVTAISWTEIAESLGLKINCE